MLLILCCNMSFQIFLPTKGDWNDNKFSLFAKDGLNFFIDELLTEGRAGGLRGCINPLQDDKCS